MYYLADKFHFIYLFHFALDFIALKPLAFMKSDEAGVLFVVHCITWGAESI